MLPARSSWCVWAGDPALARRSGQSREAPRTPSGVAEWRSVLPSFTFWECVKWVNVGWGMTRWLTTTLILLGGCAERAPTVSASEQQFGAGDIFDRVHEPLTEDAIGHFLRDSVFGDLVDEHDNFAD